MANSTPVYSKVRSSVASCAPRVVFVCLLIVSALLAAQAVSAPGYPWLAWVALLPVFLAVRLLAPLRAAVAGAFWGLCLCYFVSEHFFAAIALTPASLALFIVVPALYACLGAALTRRVGFNPLLLGVGWILAELALRPVGLEHGLLAGTQHDATLASWVGQWMGYVFVAFAIAVANAAILLILGGLRLKIAGLRRRIVALVRVCGISPQTFFRHPSFISCDAQPRAPPPLRLAVLE